MRSAPTDAVAIIFEHEDWRRDLCVRTRVGDWKSLHSVLMPGAVVSGDESRDEGATVDVELHEFDRELLAAMGVRDVPFVGCAVSGEPAFSRYRDYQEQQYRGRDDLPASHRPATWHSFGMRRLDRSVFCSNYRRKRLLHIPTLC